MDKINIQEINEYVNENIQYFHNTRLDCISSLKLNTILKKNPYLFRAKNINKASNLVEGLLSAFLSSSEEKIFGDFLEGLAIFIASKTSNGHKSSAQGIDLEILRDNKHYLISIKSGPNWGNSSQHKKLESDFTNAVKVLKQSQKSPIVQPILGICYGKTRTSFIHNYWKLVGQNFWFFISGIEDLYTVIIEPIGFRAKEQNDLYDSEKGKIENRFTKEFIERFCNDDYTIDWERLVQFNSGNRDIKIDDI
ncbi:MAG TPA: cytosolic protein [Anaerolineaceae bacterium]|nr:cytosolic protein [Anaerolineaceae bacterium]